MKLLLAIDQGTTGTTALLMNEKLEKSAEYSVDFEQHFPEPGRVEHDLDQLWASVCQAVQGVLQKANPKDVIAIGITNQRETICFWDRRDLRPLARAIVWQDRRSAEICQELRSRGLEGQFTDATGLLLDPYFSGTKVAWALKNWPAVKKAYDGGHLSVGTIDSFLVAKLSNGAAHVTEPSNASRTLAFHLEKNQFDPELNRLLGIDSSIWPEVKSSFGFFAATQGLSTSLGLPNGIPISGILGDQQAALLGQACLKEGMAKCTYGTGAFLLMNTGSTRIKSTHRLLTTIAWRDAAGRTTYALEGSAFVAGAAVQWVRDGLKWIKESSEIEGLALTVPSTEGVVFVPALTGLGAPHWNPEATGLFTGLTRGTTQGHMARAVLEGIAFQNADLLTAMQKDLAKPLVSLKVDGGAAANTTLMQFQADVLGVPLKRPRFLETTSLGAVFAAGLGIGLWKELGEIEKTWQEDRTFLPQMPEVTRAAKLGQWQSAIRKVNAV